MSKLIAIEHKKRDPTTPYGFEHVKQYIESYGCTLETREEDYANVRTKIRVRCKCDEISFLTTFKDLRRSNNPDKCLCKLCGDNTRWWSKDEFLHYTSKNSIEVVEHPNTFYVRLNCELGVKCDCCGDVFLTTLRSLLHYKKTCCNLCSEDKVSALHRRPVKETYQLILDKGFKITKFIEPYKNAHTKFYAMCEAGHLFDSSAHSILYKGRGCRYCSLSKGEQRIKNHLIHNNVQFVEEYSFDNCRNQKPLPFDFYLPSYDALIEYDGEQHFRPVDFFGGKRTFKYRQKNDAIKNKFCQSYGFNLLRIPHWDYGNIETILDSFIKGE